MSFLLRQLWLSCSSSCLCQQSRIQTCVSFPQSWARQQVPPQPTHAVKTWLKDCWWEARHGYDDIENGGMKWDGRNHLLILQIAEIIQMRHAAVFLHATIHASCTVKVTIAYYIGTSHRSNWLTPPMQYHRVSKNKVCSTLSHQTSRRSAIPQRRKPH